MDKLPEIEIWGETYEIDVSKVTIEEWQKLMVLMASGDREAASNQVVKVVMMALPDKAKKLGVMALAVLIPRVLQEIAHSVTPMDLETELDEILRMRRND